MPTTQQLQQAVIDALLARLGHYRYGNGRSRTTLAQLDAIGIADCSDIGYGAYNAIGIDIGGMSYQQATAGTEIASWSGKRGTGIGAFNKIAHLIQPADIIAMGLDHARPREISHVEYGYRPGQTIGHGRLGVMGPTINNPTASWLIGDADIWTVRRIITENTTKKEEPDMNKNQAKQLADTAWLVKNSLAPALARVDKARVATTAKLAALQAAVETIAGKTDGLGGVDIAAAIDKAVTTALADLEVTLSTKGGE